MSPEIAMRLGRALVHLWKKGEKTRPKIVIGKDTRLSGYMLESAICAGICSMGGDVLLCGPISTPGIAFITYSMRADGGIVISASHNPYQDNGIKIFDRTGFKLDDPIEERLERMVFSDELDSIRPTFDKIGKAYRIDDAIGRYIVFLKNTFPKEFVLDGYTIVIDCANGASYKAAPAVFKELGANIIPLGVHPDGCNINYNCGALYPEQISEIILQKKADIGIALDGDGDRVVFLDEGGNIIPGDHIINICATRMLKEGRLLKNTLVTTVMTNLAVDKAFKTKGGRVIRTKVGDRYVVKEMQKGGYNFGGENSGHFIFLDHTSTGDGIIAALQILAIMIKEKVSLSELVRALPLFPQRLISVPVKRYCNLEENVALRELEQKIKERLGEDGRVLIRYSGTEPKIRILVEGLDKDEVTSFSQELASLVRDILG
jgi:phosphoglucosamine mutase